MVEMRTRMRGRALRPAADAVTEFTPELRATTQNGLGGERTMWREPHRPEEARMTRRMIGALAVALLGLAPMALATADPADATMRCAARYSAC